MANLDFYAAREDLMGLFDFIFIETDCRVMESYSEFGKNLREFSSSDELFSAYDIKYKDYKQGFLKTLQLWSPSVSSQVKIKRISLDARKCDGHDFRFNVEGWGLMQLYLGAAKNETVTISHFGHNRQKRAEKWEATLSDELGNVNDWDWSLLAKISRKIQYHIKMRLAVSKIDAKPILPKAAELLSSGFIPK